MGEVVHPKISHKRIELSDMEEERPQETSPVAKRLGRHFTARLFNLRTDKEAT